MPRPSPADVAVARACARRTLGEFLGNKFKDRRPRVRKENREVGLPPFAKLQAQDLLDEQMR